MSIIRVTPAFRHTTCHECRLGFDLGERIASEADGFRHLACCLNRHRNNL